MLNNFKQQEEYATPLRDNMGALWKKRDQRGKEYLVGSVTVNGETKEIIAFINTEKRNGRQPDFVVREQTARTEQTRPRAEYQRSERVDRHRSSQHNW